MATIARGKGQEQFLSKDSSLKSSSTIGAKPLGWGAKGRAKHLSLTHNAVQPRVSAYQGIPYAMGSVGSEVGEMSNDSSDRVLRDDLAIERGAQFWRSLLRCVIDVVQTEAIRVAVGPLKVVH